MGEGDSAPKTTAQQIQEALCYFIFIVWGAIPAIWVPVALVAIWSPDACSVIPWFKMVLTHGLFLFLSVIALIYLVNCD